MTQYDSHAPSAGVSRPARWTDLMPNSRPRLVEPDWIESGLLRRDDDVSRQSYVVLECIARRLMHVLDLLAGLSESVGRINDQGQL